MEKINSCILMVITKGDLGGAQTHLYDLCLALKDRIDIQVAIGDNGPLNKKLMCLGVAVHILPSLNRAVSPINDWKAFNEISQLIKQINPDLVATHSSKAGVLGRYSAIRSGVPCIFTAHGWAFTEGVSSIKRYIYRLIEAWVARRTDRIICVSDYDRLLAINSKVASGDKIVTIHNGIACIKPQADRMELRPELRLIMVARFCEQKDHALVLQALAQIKTKKSYVLQLVGDGPDWDKSKQLAQALGIEHKVEFLGPRRDVPELLEQSDIFILSSRWEGFPITILEAMRAGLPVISSDVGGCNEAVVDGETGYLVPRGDLETMQDRLVELMENKKLRQQMGIAGYKRFLENFTAEKMVEKTLDVYQDVIQKSEA